MLAHSPGWRISHRICLGVRVLGDQTPGRTEMNWPTWLFLVAVLLYILSTIIAKIAERIMK